MAIFEITKAYKEKEDPLFKVTKLKELNGSDMTHVIDNEKDFESHNQLKKYLSEKLQIPIEHIYILEM